MSKKQKMKMLAAVLAAGSLYINSGTAFAETEIEPPTATGMSQQSQDNDVTIVVEDYMDQNSNTGKWEFNEKTGDTIYDFQKQINFSTIGGENGTNKQIVVSSLGSVSLAIDPEKGLKIKHYTGEYAYFDQNSGKVTDENGNVLVENVNNLPYDEQNRFYNEYAPVLDTTKLEHTLDVGSDVDVTTVTNPKGEKVATGITVNGIDYDINSVEFNKNEPGVGGGKYKGNWQIIDKTTGEVYENTTLDRVETVSEENTYDGYGRDYNIYDTADNELTLKDVASASKLKDVDKSAVKYDPIYDSNGNIIGYDYSKITLGGDAYNNKRGGTELTNVAYAGNIRDENGKVLGSAAVNVDYLNDQLDIAKAEVTKNDQHLNYNKDYAVDRDKNEVKLEVVDNQGNLVGETVIKDVASATDVGDITEIHNDLKNEDGSETSVVDAVNNLDDKVGDLNYKHDDNSNLNYVTAGDSVTEAIGDLDAAINNAATVGAFYQPNEDTLFSLGGTVGNDENMVNVGVSFKLGQKNHVSNNRVSMAKEIISLRDKVAKLEALMIQQGMVPQSEINMDKFFPDVPENHWAYEYVKELARLGIIDGYPDGTFSGDRIMTRYEFAAITYRALQKGVNVDKRMITEFEPELKLIRVDVIAKDKDGNPTIERVRTNTQQ